MLKQTFFMALSTGLRLLTGVVIFIVMARMWGPERYGTFMYLFTVTSLAGLVVDYGFGQQLMREIGHKPDQAGELVGGVMSAKLLLSVLIIAIAGLVSMTPWGQTQPLSLFWLLLATSIVASFAETYNAVFRGIGHFHEETRIAAWVNLVHSGLVVALLALDAGTIGVASGFFISRVWFLFLTVGTCNRLIPGVRIFSGSKFRRALGNLRSGFAFAAEAAFTNFQSQADTLIVHHYLGAGAVGLYQAGLRLMQGANTFAPILSNVYLPAMAGKVNDKDALTKLTNRLFLQMLLLGALCMFIFVLGAEPITHMLYGARYEALVELLPWFGLLLLVRFVASSHGVTLSALGFQTIRVGAIAVALTLLFLATYFLIPLYGLTGMLLASILAVGSLYLVYAGALIAGGVALGINRQNAVLLVVVSGAAMFLMANR